MEKQRDKAARRLERKQNRGSSSSAEAEPEIDPEGSQPAGEDSGASE